MLDCEVISFHVFSMLKIHDIVSDSQKLTSWVSKVNRMIRESMMMSGYEDFPATWAHA